jgi:hypothetical protein
VNPTISAYETLNGPYDWNQYPLVPLGCKAVIYEDGNTRGLWASRGIDGWYLGSLLDHYRCNVYYVPATRGYRVSGSTELFLQHCQLPTLTPHQHLRKLTDKLAAEGSIAGNTTKVRRLLKLLLTHITSIITPPPPLPPIPMEQWEETRVNGLQQRVIDGTPISTIQCITDAPAIMTSRDPTAKCNVKTMKVVH